MKTLLLVDIQNDFLPGGTLAVPGSDVIVPRINAILDRFELVVGAQDWHPANHKSFASNHAGRQPFERIDLDGMEQTLWPDHCVQGTAGAEYSAALDTRRMEAIFRKGTDPDVDSYSAFFDNGHRKTTGLADYLRGKGTTALYVAGLAGEICVHFSILDALAEGFQTHLITDAATVLDPARETPHLETLRRRGAHLLTSEALQDTP